MKVPNAERAIVAPEKITAYLLNPANRENRGKAAFFLAFGFHHRVMGCTGRRTPSADHADMT